MKKRRTTEGGQSLAVESDAEAPPQAEPDVKAAVAFIQAVARNPEEPFDNCKKLKAAVFKVRTATLTQEVPLKPPTGRRKRKVTTDRRLCSPTLFVDAAMTYDLDQYLDFVGSTFYTQTESPEGASGQFGMIRRATLGRLLSPLQPPSVLDKWCPREVALFEATICLIGKIFPQIQAVIKTKTVQECVEFYYVWKKSKNYTKWKETFKLDA